MIKQEGEILWVVFWGGLLFSESSSFVSIVETDAGSASGIYIAMIFASLSKAQS